jgi:hypothetical protein
MTRGAAISSPITDEKLNGLWLHRHDFTEAEWAEIAPILLGTLVAMRSSAPPVMGMEEMVERDDLRLGLSQVRYILRSVASGDDQRAIAPKAVEIIEAAIAALSPPLVTGRE